MAAADSMVINCEYVKKTGGGHTGRLEFRAEERLWFQLNL